MSRIIPRPDSGISALEDLLTDILNNSASTTASIAGASTAITTSYQAVAMAGFPSSCVLDNIVFEESAVSGTPSSFVFFLARDSAGDIPLTPEITISRFPGMTTAGKGGGAVSLGRAYTDTAGNTTAGTIYLVAKVGSSTSATCVPRITYTA